MSSSNRTSRVSRKTIWIATALAMAAVIGGWAAAASLSITQGTTETGGGAYHGASQISYWTEASVGLAIQPTPLPGAVSTSPASPTQLAGVATNYAINTPLAGDVSHYWKFTEAAGAPATTYLELQFTVSTGGGPTVTSIIAYIWTQGSSPVSAITFAFYFDLGSPSSGTITLNSVTEITQVCAGLNVCP